MKLLITFPIIEEKDGDKYLAKSFYYARLLESYVWKEGANLGSFELEWNNVYNFWDLKCFSMSNDKIDFEKLTTVLQGLDLKEFNCMRFNSAGLDAKGMRYWLYPKEEYGVH